MTHEQKDAARQAQHWQAPEVVASWQQETRQRQVLMEEATHHMLEAATLKPGDRVLDIAAGTGDQSLLAARIVGPQGTVVATDISEAMLKVAEMAAQQAGFTNITTHVMDAEHLTLPDHAFDAVICRQGLMLIPDLKLALREILRVLKPGGKLAAQVWSAPERNPLFSVPLTILAKYTQTPPFGAPGMFALADRTIFAQALQQAGFRNVSIQAVPLHFQAASAEAFLQTRKRMFADALKQLSQKDQQRLFEEIKQALLPMEGAHGLIASGEVLIGAGAR